MLYAAKLINSSFLFAIFTHFFLILQTNFKNMRYQLAIIGGGPAGYTAAEAAGKAGLSVVLFEKKSLGGVCLNEGCIPTKTLLGLYNKSSSFNCNNYNCFTV